MIIEAPLWSWQARVSKEHKDLAREDRNKNPHLLLYTVVTQKERN